MIKDLYLFLFKGFRALMSLFFTPYRLIFSFLNIRAPSLRTITYCFWCANRERGKTVFNCSFASCRCTGVKAENFRRVVLERKHVKIEKLAHVFLVAKNSVIIHYWKIFAYVFQKNKSRIKSLFGTRKFSCSLKVKVISLSESFPRENTICDRSKIKHEIISTRRMRIIVSTAFVLIPYLQQRFSYLHNSNLLV